MMAEAARLVLGAGRDEMTVYGPVSSAREFYYRMGGSGINNMVMIVWDEEHLRALAADRPIYGGGTIEWDGVQQKYVRTDGVPRGADNARLAARTTLTLYRGEGGYDHPSYYPKTGPDAAMAGAWWTDDLDRARQYARSTKGGQVYVIEVDESEAEPHGGPGNYVIPNPQVRARRTLLASVKTADADVEDGVMVALVPPLDVARLLVQDDMVTEPLDNQHITLVYLGKVKGVDEDRLLEAVEAWAAEHQPIVGKIRGYGTFDNDDEHVLYAAWAFEGGVDWRTSLVEALAAVGIEDASSFKDQDWTPHETLAYSDEPITALPVLPDGLPEQVVFGAVSVAYGARWSSFSLAGQTSVA